MDLESIGGRIVKCPLCGFEFEKGEAACRNCPLHKSCDMVKCPNCGYDIPTESRLGKLIRRLFRREKDYGYVRSENK